MRKCSVFLSLIVLVIAGCTGDKDVKIAVSLPPKLDLAEYDYVYFPGFVTEAQVETVDTERETLNFLKREFIRRSAIGVVNLPSIDLSDKDPRSFFVRDQPFFKSFNFQKSESTLALTGVVSFEAVDRSGFHDVEQTDYTGRRVTRSQYVEITGFTLNMKVYVYELSNGKLLYTDTLMDSADVLGSNPDERMVLYDLMERVSGRVLGLFSNTLVKAERSLL